MRGLAILGVIATAACTGTMEGEATRQAVTVPSGMPAACELKAAELRGVSTESIYITRSTVTAQGPYLSLSVPGGGYGCLLHPSSLMVLDPLVLSSQR